MLAKIGLMLATATATVAASREIVAFNFGLKQYTGIYMNASCPADAFPIDKSGVYCVGLGDVPAASTADYCRYSCCAAPDCLVWQYLDPSKYKGGGCWIGEPSQCYDSKSPWVGQGRNSSGKPNVNWPGSKEFNDGAWSTVSAPHDFMIENANFSASNFEGNAFLPRNLSWYRKHFSLPADWAGTQSVYVRFEGAFHDTTAYVNGNQSAHHLQGYTPFQIRLDNDSSVQYGPNPEDENVLALFIDATKTSSWWYTGGGLFTDVNLVAVAPLHVDFDGVDAWSDVDLAGVRLDQEESAPGHSVLRASDASVGFAIDVTLDSNSSVPGYSQPQEAVLKVELLDTSGSGSAVGLAVTPAVSVSPGEVLTVAGNMSVSQVRLWSVQDPYLYTLRTTVLRGGPKGESVDEVDQPFGIRAVHFDADKGFSLNGQGFKHRGFCDHDNFGGVGMAVPARINLYRMQMLRAVGGNARRMSHNAPVPVLLDIADRLGIMVMDEHRNYRDGDYYYNAFRDLLRRDRARASVVLMSFCNEVGCSSDPAIADRMKQLMQQYAPHVTTTANMIRDFGDEETKDIDVQGFSHKGASSFIDFHKNFTHKPTVASECCSCQQDRDEMWPDKNHYSDESSGCAASQTNSSLGLDFTSGSYTWTLFGYYGEGHTFPRTSSSYGQFDLSGFAKSNAYFYRQWWLQNRNGSVDHGVPPLQYETASVHIADQWPENSTHATRSVKVIAQGVDQVQLLLNGKQVGSKPAGRDMFSGELTFGPITFEAGNLTAVGLDASGSAVDAHTRITPGKPARIELQLDAPVPRTGTGTGKLVSDGKDAAMVRATVVDSNGVQVWGASNVVTFAITSGPAVVYGVGNGDPASLEYPKSSSRSAYHGLVRAILRSTEVSATSAAHRKRLVEIHGGSADLGGGVRVAAVNGDVRGLPAAANSVTVTASSPGLSSAELEIPLSSDEGVDGVLVSASKHAVGVPLALN